MNEYVKQAKDFLQDCNATMTIMYLGKEANENWNETRERDTYMANIRTPKGNMQIKFWDSVNNTRTNQERKLSVLPIKKPTEYDILACLQNMKLEQWKTFSQIMAMKLNPQKI